MTQWAKHPFDRLSDQHFVDLRKHLGTTRFALAWLMYSTFRDRCGWADKDTQPLADAPTWLPGKASRARAIADALLRFGILEDAGNGEVRDPRLEHDCAPVRHARNKKRRQRAKAKVDPKRDPNRDPFWQPGCNDSEDLQDSVPGLSPARVDLSTALEPRSGGAQRPPAPAQPSGTIPDNGGGGGIPCAEIMGATTVAEFRAKLHRQGVKPELSSKNLATVAGCLPITGDELTLAIQAAQAWQGNGTRAGHVLSKLGLARRDAAQQSMSALASVAGTQPRASSWHPGYIPAHRLKALDSHLAVENVYASMEIRRDDDT